MNRIEPHAGVEFAFVDTRVSDWAMSISIPPRESRSWLVWRDFLATTRSIWRGEIHLRGISLRRC